MRRFFCSISANIALNSVHSARAQCKMLIAQFTSIKNKMVTEIDDDKKLHSILKMGFTLRASVLMPMCTLYK